MYSKVFTLFHNPSVITVECQISKGLPSFNIVGLPSKSVQESKDRVKGALNFLGINLPPKKVIINLHPIDISKQGNHFDLPIAVCILKALGYLKIETNFVVAGELSLNGNILAVKSILSYIINLENFSLENLEYFVLPEGNKNELAVIKNNFPLKIKFISHLSEVLDIDKIRIFNDFKEIEAKEDLEEYVNLFESISGQEFAKYALAVAAAGNHNILMIGPPGTGKSILSKASLCLFPSPSEEDFIEIAKIYNLAGYEYEYWKKFKFIRPYRNPHHTSSYASIVGGSKEAKLGEITLAHKGILFLDEFAEYSRNVLEALREPLENKKIVISRADAKIEYPADFVLIAAMNPCPCGYYKTNVKDCLCPVSKISNYWSKISGPILDRIDISIEVSNVTFENLYSKNKTHFDYYKNLVNQAQETKKEREQTKNNSELSIEEINKFCFNQLNKEAKRLIENIYESQKLSIRKFHKILKISRTISDINGRNNIEEGDILNAYKLTFNRYHENF
ncbi:MAG: YifB family Mg chelatase-like AAA ATPase [bacterium]